MATPEEEAALTAASDKSKKPPVAPLLDQSGTAIQRPEEPKAPRQFIALREFDYQPPADSAEVVRTRIYTLGSRINERELPGNLIDQMLKAGTLGVAKRVHRTLPQEILALVEGN